MTFFLDLLEQDSKVKTIASVDTDELSIERY